MSKRGVTIYPTKYDHYLICRDAYTVTLAPELSMRVSYVYNGYDLERLVPIIIAPVGFSCKYRYYVSPPHSPHLLN